MLLAEGYTPLCRKKTEGGLEIGLANLLRGKKIATNIHAGSRHETQWEIPTEITPVGWWMPQGHSRNRLSCEE